MHSTAHSFDANLRLYSVHSCEPGLSKPCKLHHAVHAQGLPCGAAASAAFKQWGSGARHLRSLHLQDCQLQATWFDGSLASLPCLTQLVITGGKCDASALLSLHAHLPTTLIQLSLEGAAAGGFTNSAPTAPAQHLATLPSLKELHLAPPSMYPSTIRLPSSSALPALTSLSLQPDCTPMHNTLAPLLAPFTQLQQLQLSHVTDHALVQVVEQLPQLRSVHADVCVCCRAVATAAAGAAGMALGAAHELELGLKSLSIGTLEWDPAICSAPAILQHTVWPQTLQLSTLRISGESSRQLASSHPCAMRDRLSTFTARLAGKWASQNPANQHATPDIMGLELVGMDNVRDAASFIMAPVASNLKNHVTRLELQGLVDHGSGAAVVNEAQWLLSAAVNLMAPRQLRALHLHVDHVGALLAPGAGPDTAAELTQQTGGAAEAPACGQLASEAQHGNAPLLDGLEELHLHGWRLSMLSAGLTQRLVATCSVHRSSLLHLFLVSFGWGTQSVQSAAGVQQLQQALCEAGCGQVVVQSYHLRPEWWA